VTIAPAIPPTLKVSPAYQEVISLLTFQPQNVSILIAISFVVEMLSRGVLRMKVKPLAISLQRRTLQSWMMIRVAKLTRMRSGSE
jgi:hypothetical protein